MLRKCTFLPPRSQLIRQFVKRHLVTIWREQHVLAQCLRQYFCQGHGVRSVCALTKAQCCLHKETQPGSAEWRVHSLSISVSRSFPRSGDDCTSIYWKPEWPAHVHSANWLMVEISEQLCWVPVNWSRCDVYVNWQAEGLPTAPWSPCVWCLMVPSRTCLHPVWRACSEWGGWQLLGLQCTCLVLDMSFPASVITLKVIYRPQVPHMSHKVDSCWYITWMVLDYLWTWCRNVQLLLNSPDFKW